LTISIFGDNCFVQGSLKYLKLRKTTLALKAVQGAWLSYGI